MDEKKLYLLLKVLFNNGSSKLLTRNGMSFSEIAKLTNSAIENGYIKYDNKNIEFTEKGTETLDKLEVLYKKRNKDEWIERDLKNQIPKIDKDFIYLPRQDEINF